MHRSIIKTAVLAGALLSVAVPAHADVRYLVFRGTIDNGYDYAGAFGSAGDLTGKEYVAIYGFDITRGVDLTSSFGQDLVAGISYGRSEPNPIVSFQIAVDGRYVDAYEAPAKYGAVGTWDGYEQYGYAGAIGRFGSGRWDAPSNFQNLVYTFAAPMRLTEDFFGRDGGYHPGGPLGVAEQSNTQGSFDYNFAMRPDRVYITSDLSTAVPEPATWAMIIMGFGLAGSALRRRRARSAADLSPA